jgi:hypothetical protein|tara:strand:- start:3588 stop:3815 length:228 start_codon:yes stop_codon:yes gene_type:complete
MIELKKGDRVFLSKRGHNGFFYPTDENMKLISDVTGFPVYWVGGREKSAILIPASSINLHDKSGLRVPVWIIRPA